MTREEFWCDIIKSQIPDAKSNETPTELMKGEFVWLSARLADMLLVEYDKRFTPEEEQPVVYGIQSPPKYNDLWEAVEFEEGVAYLEYQNNELAFVYTPQNMAPDSFFIPKQSNDQNYPVWWANNATAWLTDIFSEIDTGGMN